MQKKVFGLDLMRSLAILLVLLSHSSILLKDGQFIDLSWLIFIDGVEIFFSLSGFLIGTILLRQLFFVGGSFADMCNFWIRRWFRTLPTYYLFLFINLLLAALHLSGGSIEVFSWKFLLFLQNFNWYFYGFYGESWSLSVEEWFYIIFPLLLLTAGAFTNLTTSIGVSIAVLILAALYFRYVRSVSVENHFMWDFQIRKIVITRLDAIVYGVIMAWVRLKAPTFFKQWRYLLLVTGVAVIILSTSAPAFPVSLYYKVFFFPIQSIGVCLCIPSLYYMASPQRGLRKIVEWISDISYSLYLCHSLIIGLIITNFRLDSIGESLVGYFTFWGLSLCIAHLSFKYFERPIRDLRDAEVLTQFVNRLR